MLIDRALSTVKNAEARLINGFRLVVDVADFDGRVLFLHGVSDRPVWDAVAAGLRPGDVFLDIGANYGEIGVLAADVVGAHGRVHLFEPQVVVCAAIRAGLSRHGSQTVELHELGLLDRDGTLSFIVDPEHSGGGRFVDDDWSASEKPLPIKDIATYLPPLVSNRRFGAKVDVEGAEPILLPWLLDQPNLSFVVFEGMRHVEEIWQLVKNRGRVLHGLQRRILGTDLMRITGPEAMVGFRDYVVLPTAVAEALPEKVSVDSLRSVSL
ncbi:MAG: FkbM family methyltransferase [Pseudomonadota bacterium]